MATHATVWSGILSQSSASLSVGYAVVKNGDDFLPATSANRASYGRSVGVAITAADSTVRSFEYQVAGTLDASISGVGSGTAGDWVIVSSTGALTRTASPGASDDVIGRCPHTTGDVQVIPTVWSAIVVVPTAFSVGTNPATAGFWRSANDGGQFVRNAANSANLQVWYVDSSNNILLGGGSNTGDTYVSTGAGRSNYYQADAHKLRTAAGVEHVSLTSSSSTHTNGKTTIVDKSGEHQTTTATTATVTGVTTTIADNTTVTVDFVAVMRAVGATAKAGRWSGTVTYYRNGGAPQIVGAASYGTAAETTAGDDVLFNLSGNDLQIQVTSADGDDRNWSIEARVQTVTNAA